MSPLLVLRLPAALTLAQETTLSMADLLAMADVTYKVSGYYDASIERGIAYDDPDVGIEWPSDVELLVSERDANAPRLADVRDELPFEF